MNKKSMSSMHFLLLICLTALLIHVGRSQSSIDSLPVRNSQDTLLGSASWSIGVALGEGVGLFGGKISYRLSNRWWLTAGVGNFSIEYPIFPLAEFKTGETRREFSLLLTPRYYVNKKIYLMTGVSVKLRHWTYLANQSEATEFAIPIGIPIAIGFESGNQEGLSSNIEAGYAQYFGRGADDIEISLTSSYGSGKSTFPGSSDFWFGWGLNYYF